MSNLIRFVVLCFLGTALSVLGQPVFPPASQQEVNAGLTHSKFVAPDTLGGFGTFLSTNGAFIASTNFKPFAATLTRDTTFDFIQFTNFTKLFTNWVGTINTNLDPSVAGTNGYVRITNNAYYDVSFAVSYRNHTNIAVARTNIFVVTTNVLAGGTNQTGIAAYAPLNAANNVVDNASGRGLLFLASNTFVNLGFLSTTPVPTNNISIESARLMVMMVPNANLGSVTGVGGGGNLSTNADQFAANSTLNIKDRALLTNIQHYGSLVITNPANGGSTGFIYLDDNGIYGGNSGTFAVGNTNQLTGLFFKSVGNTINPFTTPNASLGSNAPFNRVYATNFYNSDSLPLGAVNNTLYVATNGNNATALRGRSDYPYAAISNAVAAASDGDTIVVRAGTYSIVPLMVSASTNLKTSINIVNKTNLTLLGERGAVIDGTANHGELIYVSNSFGITIKGLTLRGRVVTNYVAMGPLGTGYGSLSYYRARHLTVEGNYFEGNQDQGIMDLAYNNTAPFTENSTNGIVIRGNFFYNIGGQLTNDAVAADGTAIVPTGGLIEDNYITDCWRGIEPYSNSAQGNNPIYNLIVRGNIIVNCIENGITTASGTNFWGPVFENNTIIWEPGYSRRGTNVNADAKGILVNGGQYPVIRGNRIKFAQQIGLSVGVSVPMYGAQVIGNVVEDTTNAVGNGTGMTLYNLYGALVQGNTIRRSRSEGLLLSGVRDSVVANNILYDPITVAGEGAALRINSSVNVNSNVLVTGNSMVKGPTGIMDYGTYIDAGSFKIRYYDNWNSGGTTADYNNLSGVNVFNNDRSIWTASMSNATIKPLVVGIGNAAGATNYEGALRGIEAGANITLTANGSNIVIAGSGGGSGGTNYPPVILLGGGGAGTNVTVGVGVRQAVTIKTNASFALNFQGTPLNGETVVVGVSNSSSSIINLTNYQGGAVASVFDPSVASNVTVFPVAATSMRFLTFNFNTNANANQSVRQELWNNSAKEMELAVAGQHIASLTNAENSIVTISNTWNGASTVVSGAGNGNTNYTINISTNSINHFYLGSSNVNISAVMGYGLGYPVYWNAYITNLSAISWGIGFSSVTNRWRFKGDGGVTNSPTVLTNNSMLFLSGVSDGTNTVVGWTFYVPGL